VRRRLGVLLLGLILLVSAGFHGYFAQHPTTSYQSADERSYGKLAINIAEQRHYGDPSTGMRDPLHWPPGAPMLFAAGHALFGSAESAESLDIPAAYWLQALVSLLSAAAAAALAALLAGRWAGVAAAALVGLYPPLILATGEQLSEPLGACLVTLGFLALAVAVRRGAIWSYAVAGVAFGLAVLTRADLLLVPFVLGAFVALALWLRARAPGPALARGAALVAGAVLVLAPWSAYASSRAGSFVPVTRGSASALFVGTYLPGNGTTVGMKRALGAEAKRRNPKLRGTPDFDLEAQSVLRVIADRHPDLDFNAAVSREGRRNITRYGRSDPVGFAGMMLNKVQRMWSRYSRGGARHTSPVIRGWHILLVLGSVAGLVAGLWRSRSIVLGAVALTIAYSTAIHMLVVSQARYNLPLMPGLLAAGVVGWAMALRARRAARDADGSPPGAVAAGPAEARHRADTRLSVHTCRPAWP
jgi:4-amino-4-deoxy-L-arabinose transferase-like glycosyltransferase